MIENQRPSKLFEINSQTNWGDLKKDLQNGDGVIQEGDFLMIEFLSENGTGFYVDDYRLLHYKLLGGRTIQEKLANGESLKNYIIQNSEGALGLKERGEIAENYLRIKEKLLEQLK